MSFEARSSKNCMKNIDLILDQKIYQDRKTNFRFFSFFLRYLRLITNSTAMKNISRFFFDLCVNENVRNERENTHEMCARTPWCMNVTSKKSNKMVTHLLTYNKENEKKKKKHIINRRRKKERKRIVYNKNETNVRLAQLAPLQ